MAGQDSNKKATENSVAFECFGSPTWTRTRDLRINSPSLYQLSYQGIEFEIIAAVTNLVNFILSFFIKLCCAVGNEAIR